MVRAPCCEKMGLKKGPWTREEDQILIDYINQHGHGNWRALPKQAGLLRCGKSCRLRWTNYLRPDIKRGNFSREEEDSIIELHELLGNRWSAIAAKLPGRTDNEIKNVWHTHLKKRLRPKQSSLETKPHSIETSKLNHTITEKLEPKPIKCLENPTNQSANSPQISSSEVSSITNTTTTSDSNNVNMDADALDNFPELDENFWSDVWSDESSGDVSSSDSQLQFPVSPIFVKEHVYGYDSSMRDDMDFWYNVFNGAGDLRELPDF